MRYYSIQSKKRITKKLRNIKYGNMIADLIITEILFENNQRKQLDN